MAKDITTLRNNGLVQIYIRDDEDDIPILIGSGTSDATAIKDAISELEETIQCLKDIGA